MADKEIVNLSTAARVGDDILLPCYVPGATDPAQKVSGAQIKESVTPQRGSDYWTEDDKAAVVREVFDALPTYEGDTEGAVIVNLVATDDGAGNVTVVMGSVSGTNAG